MSYKRWVIILLAVACPAGIANSVGATVSAVGAAPAASGAPADSAKPALAGALAPLVFLVGEWGGSGSGATGPSRATCSFEPVIQGHGLLRRNMNISPAGRHEDIMMIYESPAGIRATYADMEGHAIDYGVSVTAPGEVVFLSDEVTGMPRFRLTQQLLPDGALNAVFASAPPGSTEFKTYVEGAVRRK